MTQFQHSSANSPFIVAPCPHEEDKEFQREQGEDWWPENHESNVKCDIGGSLHELFYKR